MNSRSQQNPLFWLRSIWIPSKKNDIMLLSSYSCQAERKKEEAKRALPIVSTWGKEATFLPNLFTFLCTTSISDSYFVPEKQARRRWWSRKKKCLDFQRFCRNKALLFEDWFGFVMKRWWICRFGLLSGEKNGCTLFFFSSFLVFTKI